MKNTTAQVKPHTAEEAYLAGLKSFTDFYLSTVIFSGCAIAAAIAVAIISNVLLGVCLAILTALVYVFFTASEAKKELGISYKNEAGRIAVTHAICIHEDSIYIPSRLIWTDVTRLEDGIFADAKNKKLTKIFLPRSIEYIGQNAFSELCIRSEIYYEGTSEDWSKIQSLTDLEAFTVHFDTPLPTLPKKQKKIADSRGDGE